MEQEEYVRDIYMDSLPFSKIAPIIEAERLSEYATLSEYTFAKTAARVYGCVSSDGENENLMKFLTTLFHYGKVEGIRAERARRNSISSSKTFDTMEA